MHAETAIKSHERERLEKLVRYMAGQGIVYAGTRQKVDDIARRLKEEGISSKR